MLNFADMNPALLIKCEDCSKGFPHHIYKTRTGNQYMTREVWYCLDCMWKHGTVTAAQPNKDRMMANNTRHQDDIQSRFLAPDGKTILRRRM
jgi:hypothetical protein